jgi:hypothetical protein
MAAIGNAVLKRLSRAEVILGWQPGDRRAEHFDIKEAQR